MIVLVLAGVLALTVNPRMSAAEISADSYCQLAVQSLQQDVSNFQELIALANQYKNDPETLAQQEEIKRVESDQAKDALFSSFGTTAEEPIWGRKGERWRHIWMLMEISSGRLMTCQLRLSHSWRNMNR